MLSGLLAAGALLLVAAGLPKVWDPTSGARALASAALPLPRALRTGNGARALVRAGGLTEVALALVVLLAGGRAAAVATVLAYLPLAAFAARMARSAPGTACGCFGASSAPVGAAHIGTNAALTVVGLVSLAVPGPSLASAAADQPWAGVPYLALVGLLAWLCYLLMTALPTLRSAAARAAAVAS